MKKRVFGILFSLLFASLFVGCSFNADNGMITDLGLYPSNRITPNVLTEGRMYQQYYINYRYSSGPLYMEVEYYLDGVLVRNGWYYIYDDSGVDSISFLTDATGVFKVVLKADNGRKKCSKSYSFSIHE